MPREHVRTQLDGDDEGTAMLMDLHCDMAQVPRGEIYKRTSCGGDFKKAPENAPCNNPRNDGVNDVRTLCEHCPLYAEALFQILRGLQHSRNEQQELQSDRLRR